MRIGRLLMVFIVVPLVMLGTATTSAGPPGTWTKVSTGSISLIDIPGLYRTPDHVLHVVYRRDGPGNTSQYAQTSINAAGQTLAQTPPVLTNWAILGRFPLLVGTAGGGLRLVFGGQRTNTTGDDGNQGYLWSSTGTAAGTGWSNWSGQSFGTDTDATTGSAGAGYGVGAVTLADGTPVVAWTFNNHLYWHVGVDATATSSYDAGATALLQYASLVRDGSAVYASWYAFGSGSAPEGTYVKQLLPTVGPTQKAPGSSTTVNGSSESLGPVQPTALAARVGGGVYTAYCVGWPTCTSMRLWEVGTTRTWTIPGAKDANGVALAAAPSGRLWVVFKKSDSIVRAVRTNTSATAFGVLRTIGHPSGSTYVFAVEGSTGRADVVVNNDVALFHTQVLAGLKLVAVPTHWSGDGAKTVAFKVTDAGQGVGGAKVSAGGKACTTSAAGACSIRFGRLSPRRFAAVATKAGYWKATVTLRVT